MKDFHTLLVSVEVYCDDEEPIKKHIIRALRAYCDRVEASDAGHKMLETVAIDSEVTVRTLHAYGTGAPA